MSLVSKVTRLLGASKTSWLLVGLAFLGVAFVATLLFQTDHWTNEHINSMADEQTRLAVAFDRALRDYIAQHVRPEVEKRLPPGDFIPEAMSTSFITRRVFDNVRELYPNHLLRFPSINPRNPVNQASPDEETIIHYFQQHPDADSWTGTLMIDGKPNMVRAVPRRLSVECLRCHGKPEAAPAALTQRYGATAGFGRSVGDVSIDLAAVPLDEFRQAATSRFNRAMLAALALCATFLAGVVLLVRWDMAQRRRAADALRESESRLRSITESAHDAILMMDPLGRISYWNLAAERIIGYSSGEALGRDLHELLAPERSRAAYRQSAPAFARNGTGAAVGETRELKACRKDGQQIDITLSLSAIQIGQQWHAVGILRDETERKRMEEALRESESQFRRLFDNGVSGASVHEIMLDEQGNPVDYVFLQVNSAFETQTGLRAADILGKRVTEVLPGIENSPIIEIYGGVALSGVSVNMEHYSAQLGRHYQVNAYALGNRRFATVFQDISERKEAETRMRQQQEMLQTILDGIPDIVSLQKPDHTIIAYNRAGYEILGKSVREVEGRKCFELLGRDTPCSVCALDKAVETGRPTSCERFSPELGRWIIAHGIPIRDGSGRVAMLLEQLKDITDLKRTEEELRGTTAALEAANRTLADLNRQAEAATRAKSEFLANMSHEIRTPMTAILGYADILADSVSDPEYLESIRTIRRNGNHLLSLINDILDLSKIEARKLHAERIVCSPTDVLADVVSLMSVRAAAKGLELKLEYDGPCPASIRTDPTRLRQILVNLIGNAIKFTEVGHVRLVTRLLDGDSPQPKLQCDVIDTGVGMTPEEVHNLFQPFHQADASTSRKFGGTGLGLAISKPLAELLGGDLRAQSAVAQGSTFSLTIDTGPLDGVVLLRQPGKVDRPASTGLSSDRQRSMALGHCHVLLAEDGADNQRLISLLLRQAGAQVTVVADGQEALAIALGTSSRRLQSADTRPDDGDATGEAPAFDVILMDMQMPVMDGYEATRRLRNANYLRPIVALTAHAMAEDRQKCLAAGCDDYLTKPVDRPYLIATVARWAARGQMSKETLRLAKDSGESHVQREPDSTSSPA